MLSVSALPALNATLNATSAALLTAGYRFIRRQNVTAHKSCMIAACIVSALFLISYVTYHAQVGSVRFTGQGWIRSVYFTILISHTFLAAATVPLVVITLSRALRQRFDKHKQIAHWTLPIWLYVSITGVVIYLLLYRLYPSR